MEGFFNDENQFLLMRKCDSSEFYKIKAIKRFFNKQKI